VTTVRIPEVNTTEPPAREPFGGNGRFRTALARFAHVAGQSWKWLKWPVGLGILAWLYYTHAEAIQKLAAAPKNWTYAILAFVFIAGSTLVTFGRWYLLVRTLDFPFRLRDAIRYGFVGLVLNYVAPGSVGGDLGKAWLLVCDQKSRRYAAFATVLLDRILGLLALFIVGVIATLLPHDFPDSPEVAANTALLWIGSLAGLAGLGFMLLPATTRWGWVNRLPRLPLIGHIIGELIHGVQLYQSRPWAVLAALGLSVLGHAGLITGFYFCALWLRQPDTWIPTLTAHFYFMPNAELFGVVSMVPGGVGALEFAIQQAYVWLRPETVAEADASAAGLMAAIALRVLTVTISAIGGVYYLASRREISAAIEEASHATEPAA
jgi:uncharacterized membrane protein YbhN (UPF0104 family)